MAMQGGIKLSLLIGPVPEAASQEVVEALASAKVEAGAGETQTGFELSFDQSPRSPLRTQFLLAGGGSLKLMRVVLVVQIGGHAEQVIDGVATNVETQPGEGGVSKLVVKGKDLSALMDIDERPGVPYSAMSRAERVKLVLKRYAALGVNATVIPSIVEDTPAPTDRIPQQRGSDYAYVKRLAREAGYVFYLEPGPAPGTSKAYWGPEIRQGEPQPALSVNMDALTNVEQLNFNFEKESKTTPSAYYQEPSSKEPFGVPIPGISQLNPPLGQVPPLPAKTVNLDNTAHLSSQSARMAALAYAGQNSDSVFGSGSLDVARYGRLLKSRQLVGVRGAGLPFDGLYYVKTVSHDIKRGEYKQSFTLARNGLVSTVETVPV
jgi:hypothetical protein